MFEVNCSRCGASHLVEDGEDWAANHAHPYSVDVYEVA